jgi:GT2 family glycosyltransferase
MHEKPLVSVVLPTLERPDHLKRTLSCLFAQDYAPLEIIVVDQSETPSLSLTDFPAPGFTCLRLTRQNLPLARNRGLSAGKGWIVLFLDDDLDFGPSLVSEHVKGHGLYLEAGAITGRIRLVPPHAWPRQDKPAVLDRKTAKFLPNFDLDAPGECDFFVGCNVSFKRGVFDKVGGFDTRYIRNALYEEVDFCLRMKKAGLKVFYHPPAEVTHFRAESGGCRKLTGPDYLFIKFYNTGFFFCKNLFTLLPLAFLKAMKDEIEFYSRKKGGHSWRRAFYFLFGLVLGCARGALAALTGPLRNRRI